MKVGELLEQLGKLDPDLEVVGYSEDEGLTAEGREVCMFHIEAADQTEAEFDRLEAGQVWPKFERGPESKPVVFLEMTSRF